MKLSLSLCSLIVKADLADVRQLATKALSLVKEADTHHLLERVQKLGQAPLEGRLLTDNPLVGVREAAGRALSLVPAEVNLASVLDMAQDAVEGRNLQIEFAGRQDLGELIVGFLLLGTTIYDTIIHIKAHKFKAQVWRLIYDLITLLGWLTVLGTWIAELVTDLVMPNLISTLITSVLALGERTFELVEAVNGTGAPPQGIWDTVEGKVPFVEDLINLGLEIYQSIGNFGANKTTRGIVDAMHAATWVAKEPLERSHLGMVVSSIDVAQAGLDVADAALELRDAVAGTLA